MLQIVVWKDPEASVPAAVVRVDGKISMPLIGEVDAAGLARRPQGRPGLVGEADDRLTGNQ